MRLRIRTAKFVLFVSVSVYLTLAEKKFFNKTSDELPVGVDNPASLFFAIFSISGQIYDLCLHSRATQLVQLFLS